MRQQFVLQYRIPELSVELGPDRRQSCSTTVVGRVLDEKGSPAQGTKVSFFGMESKRGNVSVTFEVEQKVSHDGSYELNAIIPRNTNSTIVRIESADYNLFLFAFKVQVNGEVKPETNSVEIEPAFYGKKTMVDFLLKEV